MFARRIAALGCAAAMAAGIASVGSAAASTSAGHYSVVGPGVQAFWEAGTDSAGNATTTNLLVFQQLNAPGSRGFFWGVLVVRDGWSPTAGLLYEAIYDTSAGTQPTIVIDPPLAVASVSGSAPLVSCEGACPETVPGRISFDETWTATGPIVRALEDGWFDLTPGVRLDMLRGVLFTRAAALGTPDPFDGGLGDLGTLTTTDPGVRFFDVHFAVVTVCHPGACEG